MMGESVEGVIAVPSLQDPGPLLELRDAGIPTVIIDRRLDGDPFDTVLVDHRGGAREVVSTWMFEAQRLGEDGEWTAIVGLPARIDGRRSRGDRPGMGARRGARMNADALKLSVYFGDAVVSGPRLAADALMSCLAARSLAAAALLRGIEASASTGASMPSASPTSPRTFRCWRWRSTSATGSARSSTTSSRRCRAAW
jgi:hypothetical protein